MQVELDKERATKREEQQFQHETKVKHIKRTQREDIKHRAEQLEAKFRQINEHVENSKKERDHEVMIKREVRLLKEEDFRRIAERMKRKDTMRKLYIVEKEMGHSESVELIR